MGVLTARLHGSITAIAAIATASASASTDLSEKACLKDLSRFIGVTGQSILLSSLYACSVSTFNSPSENLTVNAAVPHGRSAVSPFASTSPVIWPRSSSIISTRSDRLFEATSCSSSSLFELQSASLHSYRASSASSQGASSILPNSDFVQCSCIPTGPLTCDFVQILIRSSFFKAESQFLNPFPQASFCLRCHIIANLQDKDSDYNSRPLSFYNGYAHTEALPQAFVTSLISSKPVPLCHVPTSFPRFFEASRFGRFMSSLHDSLVFPSSTVSVTLLHTWHSPNANFAVSQSDNGGGDPRKENPTVAVVLLGWLGAQQKHLRKYADWYTSRGIHAVTFVVPMRDLLSLKAGDNAEKHIDELAHHLTLWLREDNKDGKEKLVVFHTFSNTGWLTYGAILERFMQQGNYLMEKIKGCVVDSAPSAKPDPQVWASGFSAALLKKRSVSTQKLSGLEGGPAGTTSPEDKLAEQPQPDLVETALLAMLEKFFSLFLRLPYVSRRLNDVISVLSKQQPPCPQLYIYSTADSVIPVKSVESFIEEQRRAGQRVRACNFKWSPHVDHFRTFPDLYSNQLSSFLKLCIPQLPAP